MISDLYLSLKGKDGEEVKNVLRTLSIAETLGYLRGVEEAFEVLSEVKKVGESVDTALNMLNDLYTNVMDKLSSLYTEDLEPLLMRLKK